MIDYAVVLKHLRKMLRAAQAKLAMARETGWNKDAQRPLLEDWQALMVAINAVQEVKHG